MRRFALDVTSSGASHVIGAACQLLTQVVAVRTLELEVYGAYVATLAVAALFEIAFLNRANDVALHALGEVWSSNDATVLRRCYLALNVQDARWTVASFLVVLGAAWPVAQVLTVSGAMLGLAALAIPCQTGYGASKALLILKSKVRENAMFEVGFSVGSSILSIAAVLAMGVWGLVLAYVLASALKTVFARRWARSILSGGSMSVTDGSAPVVDAGAQVSLPTTDISRSVRAVGRNLMNAASEQADVIILSSFAGPAAVAVYRVAKSLGSLPSRVLAPVWVALRPGLVHMWRRGELGPLRARILLVGGTMLAALLLVVPVFAWVAPELVVVLYGAKATGVAAPLVWLFAANWILQGATAWFRHLAPISDQRTRAVMASVLQLALTVVMGLLFGRASALDMATAVTTAAIMSAAFCWVSALWLPRRDAA